MSMCSLGSIESTVSAGTSGSAPSSRDHCGPWNNLRSLVLAACLAIASPAMSLPATFEILSGGWGSGSVHARGVSADGTRVVGWNDGLFGSIFGSTYWWDASGLGHSAVPYGDPDREMMLAISADGVWAVGYDRYDPILQASEYMLWNLETATAFALDRPEWDECGECGPDDAAYAMTPDAAIIVGQAGLLATIWPAGGGALAIPTEHPATARGISADGNRIVGHSQWLTMDEPETYTLHVSSFLWTEAHGTVTLPEPLPGEGHLVYAVAISADGSTIVGYTTAFEGFFAAALVRWLVGPDGQVTTVEVLSPFVPTSESVASLTPVATVSADGSVIGGIVGTDPGIWQQGKGFTTIKELAAKAGLNLGAFHPYAVTAMTPDGNVLVGEGLECDPTDPECNWFRYPLLAWRLNRAPSSCGVDLNCDGVVNGADIGLLLSAWNSAEPVADLNGDGIVDGADLGMMLGAWTG